jgi:hypothetical protein
MSVVRSLQRVLDPLMSRVFGIHLLRDPTTSNRSDSGLRAASDREAA